MKKIVSLSLALAFLVAPSVFAQDTAGTASGSTGSTTATTTSATPTLTVTAVTPTCIQNAVAAREMSLGNAFTAFSTSMSTALSTRATALNTAWGNTDAKVRRTEIKKGWDAYKMSAKKAGYDLKMAKRTAWEAFKKASKDCKVPVVETDTTNVSVAL